MNTGGDAADLMVRESIQITESSIKLAGLGAKNLAALLIALAQDNQKLQGKTTLKRLLSEGKELKVFPLKVDDISAFKDLSKEYGVLFTPIINKAEKTAYCDVLAKAEDVSKINRIFEKMGYPAITLAPQQEEQQLKNAQSRAPQESSLNGRGSGLRETVGTTMDKRLSVKEQIEGFKAQKKSQDNAAPQKGKNKTRHKTQKSK